MRSKTTVLLVAGFLLPMATGVAEQSLPSPMRDADLAPVYAHRSFDASINQVWETWTTAAGLRTFFSPDAAVDPQVDGKYSILFYPDNPAGSRGAEGMRIIAFEPPTRFIITWNHAPRFETLKGQRTLVEYRFQAREDGGTDMQVKHFGWGQNEESATSREYFDGAWAAVLQRLEYRYEHGPLDWENVPEHLMYSGPTVSSSEGAEY